MVLKTFEIPLDIENEIYSPTELLFRVSRNDFESIELQFIISQDNATFDLTGTTVELAIRKPSGLSVFQLCDITNAPEGKATTRLSIQAYVEQGIHTAEVYVRTGGSMVVTTPFYFSSREAIMQTEEVESVNDWSALQEALFAYDLKPILSDGFPTDVPEYVGQMAFDIVNNNAYIANDLFSTSWQPIGSGEGGGGGNDTILGETVPTVVPARIGQLYIDTVARAAYVSTGTTADDWEQIDAAGGTGTVTWAEVTEKPATFPPENHMHNIAAVEGLQIALDGKADDAHSHTFEEITAKPLTYPPDAHTHLWEHITDKPTTFTPPAEYLTQTEGDNRYALKGSDGGTVQPAEWGQITGDISLQTDLQNALAGKADDADLTGKSDVGHTHTASEITDFGTAVAGAIPPEYLTETEGDTRYKAAGSAPEAHTHVSGDITDFGTAVAGAIPAEYLTESEGDLRYKAAGSAPEAHTHAIADVTNLQITLDGKADDAHSHTYEQITEKPATFPPPIASANVVGGVRVGNGLQIAGTPAEYLTLRDGVGIKTNPSTLAVDVDRTQTDTWYAASEQMNGLTLWRGTQAEYDAIATKDPNTLYFIVG